MYIRIFPCALRTAVVGLALTLSACDSVSNKPAATGERAMVIARAGLTLRANPDASSASLGLLPYKTIVAMLEVGPAGSVDDSGNIIKNRWFKAEHQGRTGWLFGGYLFLLKDIELNAVTFSDGALCDPITYSEYTDFLRVDASGSAVRTLESAHELGGPCAGLDRRVDSGTYTAENGIVTVILSARRTSLEYFENNPACPKPPATSTSPLHNTQRFYTGQCSNASGLWQNALFDPDADDAFLVLHENAQAP
jgi:Bacterial SH3 domain